MDELAIHECVKKYARLKKRKQEIEAEMSRLRSQIIEYCDREKQSGFEAGRYQVRLVRQERKEYNDQRLYDALADPHMWKLVSKADTDKIAGLLRLGVLTPELLADTYTVKRITLLQIEKT